jgi:hypothetical protein
LTPLLFKFNSDSPVKEVIHARPRERFFKADLVLSRPADLKKAAFNWLSVANMASEQASGAAQWCKTLC